MYMTKVWLKSDINKWYEAENPMMLSTNSSLEAQNNVLKRDYTGRKRLSMPHLVEKLKEMVVNWSKNPAAEVDREETVNIDTLNKFILFRPVKASDRPMLKEDKGVVTGALKYVRICPRQAYNITTREQFAANGKDVVKRRQNMG